MDNADKKGSLIPIVIVMFLSLLIAFYWDKAAFIKNSVHAVLDPSFGALINWNLEIGMILIILLITVISTLIQKFATDQKAMKELRQEQKILSEEMKKYRDHPEKMAEFSKKQMEFFPRTMRLTSRAMLFTSIPLILFFRWFSDVFAAMGNPKFFGIFGWFLFYLVLAIVFSAILKKVLKVV